MLATVSDGFVSMASLSSVTTGDSLVKDSLDDSMDGVEEGSDGVAPGGEEFLLFSRYFSILREDLFRSLGDFLFFNFPWLEDPVLEEEWSMLK